MIHLALGVACLVYESSLKMHMLALLRVIILLCLLKQQLSNFSMPQSHLEGLRKHRFLGIAPQSSRISESVVCLGISFSDKCSGDADAELQAVKTWLRKSPEQKGLMERGECLEGPSILHVAVGSVRVAKSLSL